jgi:hypothetical protein
MINELAKFEPQLAAGDDISGHNQEPQFMDAAVTGRLALPAEPQTPEDVAGLRFVSGWSGFGLYDRASSCN